MSIAPGGTRGSAKPKIKPRAWISINAHIQIEGLTGMAKKRKTGPDTLIQVHKSVPQASRWGNVFLASIKTWYV
jgi:hypothetical protein